MSGNPVIIGGLRQIAGEYDALICDVWGVVHDGVRAFPKAVEALERFRGERGRVVLLSNAPRPAAEIEEQLAAFGVPGDAYDAVVTSGGAARDDLARRARTGTLAVMHIGPDRDRPVFEGLSVRLTGAEAADVVLCTGLFDDEVETPESYRATLVELRQRDLPMICANPDVLVPRGGKLVHCAGGIARAYEAVGGKVAYYGKPHAPIYEPALEAAGRPKRSLVVGDALETDIAGANAMGLDALFVVNGLHGKEVGALTSENLAAFFGRHRLSVRAAIGDFAW
ncbi:MAG TPA: TIGR01459 family HAD-type hydrolase [Rhizomicrobium sp.]|nr:TIGR01459 family HAD-type hydrolase [Rhizomicrobium sp.]